MVRTRPFDLVVVFSAEYQAVHVYIPKCTQVRGVHDCHEVYEYRSSTHFSTVSLNSFFPAKGHFRNDNASGQKRPAGLRHRWRALFCISWLPAVAPRWPWEIFSALVDTSGNFWRVILPGGNIFLLIFYCHFYMIIFSIDIGLGACISPSGKRSFLRTPNFKTKFRFILDPSSQRHTFSCYSHITYFQMCVSTASFVYIYRASCVIMHCFRHPPIPPHTITF